MLLTLSLAVAAPVDLTSHLNNDLLDAKGNDAWCVPVAADKGTLPIGAPAGQLRVRWTGDANGIVEIHFSDGAKLRTSAEKGAEVGAPGGPSYRALPVSLGKDATGHDVLGSEWTVATGRPATPITEIVVTRSAGKRLCITEISLEPSESGIATDTTGWYPFPVGTFPATPFPNPLPVEAPAGKRGKVGVDADGHLTFADGTRARFWGVDLYTQNALPPKDRAERYAAGLAALGVNIVRLHHMDLDSHALLNPKRATPGEPTFDAAALDRLDFFFSKLKEHGIYLFLEFATARRLLPSDGVSGPGMAPSGHKLLPMWMPDWEAAYEAHMRGVWDRTNPYTKQRYAEDPAVAIVELSNEHSLVLGWGGALQALPEIYREKLADRFTTWLKARYADDAALTTAWACGCAHPGLDPDESLTSRIKLDPGAGSIASAWPEARRADLLTFLSELERDYYRRLTATARAMGFTQPISPTLGYGRPELEALHDTAQVSDLHISWDYPVGLESLKNDGLVANPWSERSIELASIIGQGRAATISELNHPAPNRFQAEAPWAWTTIASVQDWDALIWNDIQLRDNDSEWEFAASDLSIHPLKLAQFTSASAAFRAGWVPPASGYLPVYWSPAALQDQLLGRYSTVRASSSIPGVLSQRIRAVYSGALPATVPGTPNPGIGWWSDPGVLSLDLPKLRVRIGPPATQAKDGVGPLSPAGLVVESPQWAAVALTSADGADLTQCRQAILTVATQQEFTGQRWAEAGKRWAVRGSLPLLIEPFRGKVRFAFPSKPTVTRLSATGARMAPVKVTSKAGMWEITLDDAVQSPIFWVEAAG